MIQLAGIVVGAALAAGGLVVPAAAADQATAEAAVDAFTQRMVDAGFTAEADDGDDGDADDDDEGTESSIGAGDEDADDSFDECFAESGIPVPDDPDAPLPGATAEAESPEMVFAPEGEPASTDMFDFSAGIPESVSVMVTTVDESSAELMTQLVTWMGSKAAAECFEQSAADDLVSTGDEDDDMDIDLPAPEIEMSNGADIGVGDVSARFDMSFSMVFIVEIDLDMTMLIAQTGRSMAMLVHVTGADGPSSGIDPIAELQAVVDDLAA